MDILLALLLFIAIGVLISAFFRLDSILRRQKWIRWSRRHCSFVPGLHARLDRTRALLGDTDPNAYIFSDEEIQTVLDQTGGVYSAIATLLGYVDTRNSE